LVFTGFSSHYTWVFLPGEARCSVESEPGSDNRDQPENDTKFIISDLSNKGINEEDALIWIITTGNQNTGIFGSNHCN